MIKLLQKQLITSPKSTLRYCYSRPSTAPSGSSQQTAPSAHTSDDTAVHTVEYDDEEDHPCQTQRLTNWAYYKDFMKRATALKQDYEEEIHSRRFFRNESASEFYRSGLEQCLEIELKNINKMNKTLPKWAPMPFRHSYSYVPEEIMAEEKRIRNKLALPALSAYKSDPPRNAYKIAQMERWKSAEEDEERNSWERMEEENRVRRISGRGSNYATP